MIGNRAAIRSPGIDGPGAARPFWARRRLWAVLMLASIVPFLFCPILPFNDLPNHIGRHYVFLNVAGDPFLQSFYQVHWMLIGNLGVDVLVRLIGPVLGADLATRVVVTAIAPLTILGIYSLARATGGQVPPAALAAVPLAYSWPLITGFTNFCLGSAVALLVLALWIRLRVLSFALRLLIFAPLGFMTWVAHTAAWGLLGLGVFAYEVARACQPRVRLRALLLAPAQTLPFALMFVFTLLWRTGTSTGIGITWADDIPRSKFLSLVSLFREHFMAWDFLAVLVFVGLLALFLVGGGRRPVWTALAISAAYLVAFLLCPAELFKSGFADRRLLAYGVLLLPLAIGVDPARADPRLLRIGALAALAFVAVRWTVTTVVWARASAAQEAHLAVLDKVPPHSRIFGLVVEACGQDWNRIGRPDHIQQYALLRRRSFVNGLFQVSGLNQVQVRYADFATAEFDPNMLAVVHDARCPVSYIPETLQSAMAKLPRGLYDYVWIIGEEPLRPFDTRGLVQVATQGDDRLFRVTGR